MATETVSPGTTTQSTADRQNQEAELLRWYRQCTEDQRRDLRQLLEQFTCQQSISGEAPSA